MMGGGEQPLIHNLTMKTHTGNVKLKPKLSCAASKEVCRSKSAEETTLLNGTLSDLATATNDQY